MALTAGRSRTAAKRRNAGPLLADRALERGRGPLCRVDRIPGCRQSHFADIAAQVGLRRRGARSSFCERSTRRVRTRLGSGGRSNRCADSGVRAGGARSHGGRQIRSGVRTPDQLRTGRRERGGSSRRALPVATPDRPRCRRVDSRIARPPITRRDARAADSRLCSASRIACCESQHWSRPCPKSTRPTSIPSAFSPMRRESGFWNACEFTSHTVS